MTGANQKLGKLYNDDMKGFSSFEVDTDSCFDEFDSESVTLDYFKERFEDMRICLTRVAKGSPQQHIIPFENALENTPSL